MSYSLTFFSSTAHELGQPKKSDSGAVPASRHRRAKMSQERTADQQQVSGEKSTDTAFELTVTGVDEIGEIECQVLLPVTQNTGINTIVATAKKEYGKGSDVLVRYQGRVLPQNLRLRDLGIQGDAQLYMEKVEYEPAPKRAKTVETDYELLDPEHDKNEATKENEEPKRELTEEEKKLLDELWTWKTSIDMQQVSHIGGEETENPWKILQGKEKKHVAQNPELLNHLAALRYQYSSGFTGRPKRKRTSQMR